MCTTVSIPCIAFSNASRSVRSARKNLPSGMRNWRPLATRSDGWRRRARPYASYSSGCSCKRAYTAPAISPYTPVTRIFFGCISPPFAWVRGRLAASGETDLFLK